MKRGKEEKNDQSSSSWRRQDKIRERRAKAIIAQKEDRRRERKTKVATT